MLYLRMNRPTRGDARIAPHLEDGPRLLVLRHELGLQLLGVHDHRPELEHVERPAVLPDPRLLEEHRASRGELDGQRDARP